MKRHAVFFLNWAGIFLLFLFVGCASSGPGGSSAGAGTDNSGKQKLLELLGKPDKRRDLGAGNEEWIYYNVKKNLLEDDPPLQGGQNKRNDGKDTYDMIRVTFGPLPGFAPAVWWYDFKRLLGVPDAEMQTQPQPATQEK